MSNSTWASPNDPVDPVGNSIFNFVTASNEIRVAEDLIWNFNFLNDGDVSFNQAGSFFIATAAGQVNIQPASVHVHSTGDITEIADGTHLVSPGGNLNLVPGGFVDIQRPIRLTEGRSFTGVTLTAGFASGPTQIPNGSVAYAIACKRGNPSSGDALGVELVDGPGTTMVYNVYSLDPADTSNVNILFFHYA
jgi:hypothetical protein